MQNNRAVGAAYEQLATDYLIDKGYKIKCRNYHAGRYGELDIIAEDTEGMLVICECKYRQNGNCGAAEMAVNFRKQKQICKTTLSYYRKMNYDMDYPCRFDVIAISGDGKINHIENAFDFV